MSMPPYSAHEEQIMRSHYPHWKAAEVDYIKATGGDGGGFFADAGAAQDRPAIAPQQGAHNPFLLAGGRK